MTITLATLPQATAQQVFAQVAIHLLTQKQKSINDINRCMYRGPYGLKCAAGCLIADDEYSFDFEGNSWASLMLDFPTMFPENHKQLIGELQYIHDDVTIDEWYDALTNLAMRHSLNYDCLVVFR